MPHVNLCPPHPGAYMCTQIYGNTHIYTKHTHMHAHVHACTQTDTSYGQIRNTIAWSLSFKAKHNPDQARTEPTQEG